MKSTILIGAVPLVTLVAGDSVTVQNNLGCTIAVRGNVVDLACFKVSFTDGNGNVFNSDCGFSSVAGACNGFWETQTPWLDIGSGYNFHSDGTYAIIESANGQYNAWCIPQQNEGFDSLSCELEGDTDPSR